MCSRAECQRYVGKYIRFQTPYGYHEGIIESIRGNQAVVLSPRHYIPAQLVSESVDAEDMKRLDLALAWGYPGGYGGGHRGYGYGYGWGRWAVSFLVIFLLWGLLW